MNHTVKPLAIVFASIALISGIFVAGELTGINLYKQGCEKIMSSDQSTVWLECSTEVVGQPVATPESQASKNSRQAIQECKYAGGHPVTDEKSFFLSCSL